MTETVLAIETATGPCSVALYSSGKVLYFIDNSGKSAQSAVLFPMIGEALKQAGMDYRDLTAVACTAGPGSFTGIRVGLAAARGICFAAKIPGMGFTTLETLAFAAGGKKTLATLNAGKGEVYYQAFGENGLPLFDPRLGTMEDASASAPGAHVAGYGAQESPRADALARLAATCPRRAGPLTPFYIRPPDAVPQFSLPP